MPELDIKSSSLATTSSSSPSSSSTSRHLITSRTETSHCLSAFRHAARKRLSDPPARVIQSNTNERHREVEKLLFREILAGKTLSHIARNFSRDGMVTLVLYVSQRTNTFVGHYHNVALYPQAYKYIEEAPRLTEDKLLQHVLWRLEKSGRWEEKWEKALFGQGGREGFAWALCETDWREYDSAEKECLNYEGDCQVGRLYCVHGKKIAKGRHRIGWGRGRL